MKKLTTKIISVILTLLIVFSMSVQAFAAENKIANIDRLVQVAEMEIANKGEASTETVKKLEVALKEIGVETGSYSGTHQIDENVPTTRGYGETHDLGKGWSYRVDKPFAGEAKPHVHVDNNHLNVHSSENVDGTPSHKKTLNGSNVPNDVQKKLRGLEIIKKGKKT